MSATTHGATIRQCTDPEDGVYLECDQCVDIVCGLESGMALTEVIESLDEHARYYHEEN
jgi:hypothetical protein